MPTQKIKDFPERFIVHLLKNSHFTLPNTYGILIITMTQMHIYIQVLTHIHKLEPLSVVCTKYTSSGYFAFSVAVCFITI